MRYIFLMESEIKFIFLCIFHFLLIYNLNAQNDNNIDIRSVKIGKVKMVGFSLKQSKEIQIEATGAGEKFRSHRNSMMDDPNYMFAYAWIIDAKLRKPVWQMTLSNTKKVKETHFNRKFKGSLFLPAGEYEVYFSALVPDVGFIDDGFFSLGRLFDKIFRQDVWYEEDKRSWYLHIEGVDKVFTEDEIKKHHQNIKDESFISLTNLYNSEYRQIGFELGKEGLFKVYAIGEAFEENSFDYAWISNAATSEKVWETLVEQSEHAGGAIKNRVWNETINLKPGTYWVYYIMDDSHSPHSFNSNPPYDIYFYGITLTGVPGHYDPKSVKVFRAQKVKPFIQLTRLGNDDYVQEAFKVISPMQIRIYAVGEGRRGEMYDYGWISDLESGEKVWEMTYNRTRHAGGADKNRLVDDIITLAAGSYIVHYITDDSHSYQEWNNTPPYNPARWGITVYPADPKYDDDEIHRLKSEDLLEQVITQIVRARDGRLYQERFEVENETKVRVYGIGEGDWDEMYDYGWIENVYTGKKIWEMTYEKTKWAGGTKKNRLVNEIITLPAAKYMLVYSTDNSHSFQSWNDDPPDDPIHYGITLFRMPE